MTYAISSFGRGLFVFGDTEKYACGLNALWSYGFHLCLCTRWFCRRPRASASRCLVWFCCLAPSLSLVRTLCGVGARTQALRSYLRALCYCFGRVHKQFFRVLTRCSRCFAVCCGYLRTSPNSCAKIVGGFQKSEEKDFCILLFVFCAVFLFFLFFFLGERIDGRMAIDECTFQHTSSTRPSLLTVRPRPPPL